MIDSGVATILARPDQTLLDVIPEEIRARVKRDGCILFRGFSGDEETFRRFTEQFAERFILDIGASKRLDSKAFSPKSAFVQPLNPQKGDEQDLHQENGRWSDIPDLLWFYVAQPASDGGETKVADGIEIWRALDGATREFFSRNKICYRMDLSQQAWRHALQLFFIASLQSILMRGVTMTFHDDGSNSMTLTYVTSAVNKPRYSEQSSFTNSLLGPYQGISVGMAEGGPVPDEMINDLKRVHRDLTVRVRCQAGDVLMLDNTRFLHGRTAYTDRGRRVYSVMATANF